MKLKDKISLVTGGGRGIGKAIAIALAEEGSTVVVNDIDEKAAQEVSRKIIANGGKSIAIKADVSKRKDVKNMMKRIIREFKRIDILINNAGIQKETPFISITEEEWDNIIGTNLKGAFLCSQFAAKEMIKQGGGKIINISSIHESFPRKNIAHYASSKGGLAMLTKVMALELAEYKISVVAIAPGVVATSMNEELLRSPQKMREMISRIPLRRIAKPEDIARVVVYVASEEANYITGTTIYVDGGFSLIGHDKP